MEVVTHFLNDTVEFYKWSLTIAGESTFLGELTFLFHSLKVSMFTHVTTYFIQMKSTFLFSSSRQEGGELANDVYSHPHTGHQLPVPVLPVGGA